MKRWTFSILFFIKKTKLLKNLEAPVFLRITFNGERAETTINRSIEPKLWNELRGCARLTHQNGKELNQYLDQIRHQIYELQRELIDKKEVVTALSLKNVFLKNPEEENFMVLKLECSYNE